MKKKYLPPDPEGMNDERAEWAQSALTVFMQQTGQTDEAESISDLIADLLHLCDRLELCPGAVLSQGEAHYQIETTPE
jgi:hypothetical protein